VFDRRGAATWKGDDHECKNGRRESHSRTEATVLPSCGRRRRLPARRTPARAAALPPASRSAQRVAVDPSGRSGGVVLLTVWLVAMAAGGARRRTTDKAHR
jgi:hypothetical protein